jgi:capsular polysaccharide biosynthesis protein
VSRKIGKWVRPLAKGISSFTNPYKWLGIPSSSISAYQYPNTLIEPARGYMMNMPLGPEIPPNMTKRLMQASEARVWIIENAIATARASHYDSNGNLLWELSEQFKYNCPADHPDFHFKIKRVFDRWHLHPSRLISAVIDGRYNIYHWLYDGLPRLALVERMGIEIESLYVDTSRPFVLESLEMAGIRPKYILDSSRYSQVQAREMVIPSFPLYSGKNVKPVVPDWALRWLRDRLVISDLMGTKRIFISRQDASYRHLVDEDLLFKSLEKRGFERVVLSGQSLQTQRALFSQASVIVAPHGAGLANILFCQPGTKILELFHPGFVQQCYWELANMFRLPYFCLTGSSDSFEKESEYPFAPIRISEKKLMEAIDFMGLE